MPRYSFSTVVEVPHAPEVAFSYLVEPRNRPEWQASLVSVTLGGRDEEPHVGMTWTDQTMAGVRPRLELTELQPYKRFAERGTWRGVTGVLSMVVTGTPTGSRIVVSGHVEGTGPWRLPARAGAMIAGRSIAADLRRAGRILDDRGPR